MWREKIPPLHFQTGLLLGPIVAYLPIDLTVRVFRFLRVLFHAELEENGLDCS